MLAEEKRPYCFVSWEINHNCNFNCEYCYQRPMRERQKKLVGRALNTGLSLVRGYKAAAKRKKAGLNRTPGPLLDEIDGIIQRFQAYNRNFTFGFTGGEPLIYPGFVEICRRLVEKGGFRIALDSNLGVKAKEFMEAVPAASVEYIYASMHILEREHKPGGLDRFLDNICKMQNSGYKVTVNYVLYPPLIERFEKDVKYCADRGVKIVPKSFKGPYNGKNYPDAYTDEERALLFKYDPGCDFAYEVPNNFGRRCNAGMSLLRVDTEGFVSRCVGDKKVLGNVYSSFTIHDSPQPCQVNRCPCFTEDLLFGSQETRKTE